MGLWNLPVLPAPGKLIVPTWRRAEILDYLEPIRGHQMAVSERSIRFTVDGQDRYKVGLRAVAVKGRAGYMRQLNDERSTLVVRNFFVNPSGSYVNQPWENPDDLGYAFQAYNDDGGSSSFGEMEYHSTAVGGDSGHMEHRDRSQVWAFRRPADSITAIAEHLLGD
jgi:hypothetical protein